jgi:hypothetical protein
VSFIDRVSTESEQLSRELELRDAKIINLTELLKAARDIIKRRGGYATHVEQMKMLDIEFALERPEPKWWTDRP